MKNITAYIRSKIIYLGYFDFEFQKKIDRLEILKLINTVFLHLYFLRYTAPTSCIRL